MDEVHVVNGKKDYFSYSLLYFVIRQIMKQAERNDKFIFINCLSTMVFCAFMLEAYINHIGNIEYDDWFDKIDRKKNPEAKLKMLLNKKNEKIDFFSRPFITFVIIFSFRNNVAHSKTVIFNIEDEKQIIPKNESPKFLKTIWETEVNLENVRIYFEDAILIIKKLHPLFGFNEPPFDIVSKEEYKTEIIGTE